MEAQKDFAGAQADIYKGVNTDAEGGHICAFVGVGIGTSL